MCPIYDKWEGIPFFFNRVGLRNIMITAINPFSRTAENLGNWFEKGHFRYFDNLLN